MQPGFYRMSFEEYQQIQAVNNSRLVAYSKTPAHALIVKDDTTSMRIGRAVHACLLEPDIYERKWAVMPEGMIRRGEKWKTWQEEHKESEILNATEETSIKGIVASLTSGDCETARKLIELCGNETETVLVWKHPKFGCLCKARLDGFNLDLKLIMDLKSSANADPEGWIKTGVNSGFLPHWQPAWYLQGAQTVIDPEFKTFLWILMETKEPFGISVVQAAPALEGQNDMVYLAQIQIEQTLERYLESERTGRFPGYPDKIVMGELPSWYIKTAL